MSDPEKKSKQVHENLRRILRRMREERGWSLTRMAAESHLGRKAISFIEDGERQPKLDSVIRMSMAFGTPFSEVLKEAGW